jgi:hypothetical protein
VRAAGKHDVFERIELFVQRGVDARIGVAEQIDPPRTDCIEITAAFVVIQPDAATARDRQQRQRLVLLHLRARMPHRARAACKPFGIGGAAHHPLPGKCPANRCLEERRVMQNGNRRCNILQAVALWRNSPVRRSSQD